MSVRILESPTANLPAVSADDLVRYFHEAAKPPTDWRVGTEFEKFLVNRHTGQALTYDEPTGLLELLNELGQRFGYRMIREAGRLTALTRDHTTVTLEPGGQVEVATPPCRHLNEIAQVLSTHLAEIRELISEQVAIIAAGVHPWADRDTLPLVPRQRYAVMAKYLPVRSPTALDMMKLTASIQVTFDFQDEADAARKMTVALKLSPLVNAIWANAPLSMGRLHGEPSRRVRIWQFMDADRSGYLLPLLREGFSFAGYVDYMLDRPMMFYYHDGEYTPARGRTFRDFLENGCEGHFPTIDDWEMHLTTVFPEVRLKRFLEVRGADAVPTPLALAVPAFWKGLLYDRSALFAAEEISLSISPDDLPRLSETVASGGLAAVWGGRRVAEWCAGLLRLAETGLRRQAQELGHSDESLYLQPAMEVVESSVSPGMRLLQQVGDSPQVAELITHFEYPR